MNFRVFNSSEDLFEGLREAIDRATAEALTPHVGIVGELPSWLGALLRRAAHPLRLVGDPAAVQQAIDNDDQLAPAQPQDLGEPLDLVIIVGLPPARPPEWLIEARSRFVALTRREDFVAWLERPNEETDRGWYFVLEDHWRHLVGSMNGARDEMTGETLNGDE